jgi:ATP-binding cassette subfamily G (WHITE) protein 2 (SNQ2)
VQPPNGESCEAWLGPFISSGGGYINNPSDNSNCQCT